jgi:hypothetical protein
MTSCATCKKYTGRIVCHDENGCPLKVSLLCRRCHHRGHLASQCTHGISNWERPTTLEELIPSDVRLRYGINTHTRVEFAAERGAPGTESEHPLIRTEIIPDDYTQKNDFVKRHKIPVEKTSNENGKSYKPTEIACEKAICEWAVRNGIRIIFSKEVTPSCATESEVGTNSVPQVNEVHA